MSEFLQPTSLEDALVARRDHQEYQLIAGGTDLLVASKDRVAPVGMIDLTHVAGLAGISDGASGGVRIGALTTYAEVLGDARISTQYSVLHCACREVGASQIQARGTLGGNIATSSPVGDSLPALLALDAELELVSTRGVRRVPYSDFLTGYRKVDLAADEIIAAIHLPAAKPGSFQYWRKVGTRRAQSISKVMIAAVGQLDGDSISFARIALGAVADRTIRVAAAEEAIIGKPANEATAELARQAVRSSVTPIDDLRSTAEYRLVTAENLVARFVLNLGTSPNIAIPSTGDDAKKKH